MTEEARRELEALLSRLEPDSGALERKEERLFALRALARKYQRRPRRAAGRARRFPRAAGCARSGRGYA